MSITQREISATYQKETIKNLRMLSKVRPMVSELSLFVFKESSLKKLTENLFIELSYYLITIIDEQAASKLTWPLFDSKAKRSYRNELYKFICENGTKGLSPIKSSFFVNPSCYKMTVLIFQMCRLALSTLVSQMVNPSFKKVIGEESEMYKSKTIDTVTYVKFVESKTCDMQHKLSDHITKRRICEKIASKLRKKIIEIEKKLLDLEGEKYIHELVDNYISQNMLDNDFKQKILGIKNVKEDAPFFKDWLSHMDDETNKLKTQWDNKATPFLNTCRRTADLTEAVVMRYMGQTEKSSYKISYDPKSDKICTKDLESQVNVEQKYILKNLDIDGRLNFPNLIKAFIISISFILKDIVVDDQVYKYNEYLDTRLIEMHEIVLGLRSVMKRISDAEARLQYTPLRTPDNYGIRHIYPGSISGPSLSKLTAFRDSKEFFDTFTPLASNKQNNYLYRSVSSLRQPLKTPIQPPKFELMKSTICYKENPNYDQSYYSNISTMSHIKSNETIAECTSGFTRNQINRLLSSKKTSSSKKFTSSIKRPVSAKKVELTYDSGVSIGSSGFTRSHSSPNLFVNKEKRFLPGVRIRKLSIMQEDRPLELSGFSVLDNDSNYSTPGVANAESYRKSTTPLLVVTNAENNSVLRLDIDLSKETNASTSERKSLVANDNTPKTNPNLIKITSSIEKIINRFKKVRASVIPPKDLITEEKESQNADSLNRFLLPEIMSPTFSFTEEIGESSDMDFTERRPRESLGVALGIDETFLDQFDLID